VVNTTFWPPYPRERYPVLIVEETGWASLREGAENHSPTGMYVARNVHKFGFRLDVNEILTNVHRWNEGHAVIRGSYFDRVCTFFPPSSSPVLRDCTHTMQVKLHSL
jgi:hypothetical protein